MGGVTREEADAGGGTMPSAAGGGTGAGDQRAVPGAGRPVARAFGPGASMPGARRPTAPEAETGVPEDRLSRLLLASGGSAGGVQAACEDRQAARGAAGDGRGASAVRLGGGGIAGFRHVWSPRGGASGCQDRTRGAGRSAIGTRCCTTCRRVERLYAVGGDGTGAGAVPGGQQSAVARPGCWGSTMATAWTPRTGW
jgi:hypothetical protein